MDALIARAVRPIALSQTSLPFIYVLSLALSAIVIPIGSATGSVGVAHAQGVFAIVGPDAVSHDENSTAVVAVYTVTGAQPNTDVTWSVDGTDARRLRISAAGELTFTSARNFENPNDGNGDNIYEIQLSASAGSDYEYIDVAVTIRDVNEPPQFDAESASLSVVENAPSNRKVGAALAATDVDDGDDWTFSLSGGDTTLFWIEQITGQIRVRPGVLLDHEADSDYAITAVVTDIGGLSDSIPISISVLDDDDSGVISFDATHSYVGVPIIASLSDDDGVVGSIRWRWSRAESSDEPFQQIQGALSDSYTPTQADSSYVLRAAATYTDSYDSNKTAHAVTGAVLLNGPPEFNEGMAAKRQIADGSIGGTEVGAPVTATDPQGDSLSYSLSGTDVDNFAINVDTGQISVGADKTLSMSEQADHTVTVSVTDDKNESGEPDTADDDAILVTINVVKVNHPPLFSAETIDRSVQEEAASGTNVGLPVLATDSDNDVLTYALSGEDSALFAIDPSTAQITVGAEPLAAAATHSEYSLTVTATDPGNLSDTVIVAITVTSLPSPLEVTGLAAVDYAENSASTLATYIATDPESNDPITWAVGGTDATWFDISSAGVLTFKTAPNFELPRDANQDNIYEITITASDGNLNSEVDVTVTVTNVNEAPTVMGTAALDYAENSSSAVATYTATDPENDDPITWTVDGADAPRFSISSTGALTFKTAPNFELPRDANQDNIYEITVSASDGNLNSEVDVTVTVTNVNEAPTVTGSATVDYAENSTSTVATYIATDPENDDPITWSVGGTDAPRFTISSAGVLTLKAPPDFELPRDANQNNVYEITITASDGNLSAEVDVTVTVTNVNEAPTITGPAAVDYAENSSGVVATYTATDPESDDPIAWTVDGTDAPRFSINSAGSLTFKTPPDFELPRDANQDNIYEITITASDGNLSAEVDVTVTVTNVNEAPTITGPAAVDYAENSSGVVATYTATDPESDDPIAWTVDGTDAPRFSINSAGSLTFKTPPDFELPRDANQDNIYEITITASDGNLSAEVDVTVTVTNVNEAPTITGPAAVDYAENSSGAVATYTAMDPESDDPITWSVDGTDAPRFAISSTGALTFKASPNFELPRDANQDNIYEITVNANDGNLSAEVDVTVTVTNVNEAPTVTGLAAVDYAENSTSSVAAYTATDPEGNDPITWSVGSTDASHFAINEEGVLSFKIPPDYENPGDVNQDNTYEITITASDGGLSASLEVSVTVTDINEAVVITGPTSPNYAENGIAAVAEYSAEGLDTEEPIVWKVEGVDASHFAISEEGALSFKAPPDFEDPDDSNQDNVYEITIAATDGRLSASLDVMVTIGDVNEAAAITGPTSPNYAENGLAAVAEYSAEGLETEDPIAWKVEGVDASHFAIDEEGVLSFKAPPDFEDPDDSNQDNVYEITISATDGSLSASLDVMVTVTDIIEATSITGPASPDYAENGIAAVAEYSAEGLETEEPITWEVEGVDASHFAISEEGALSFKAPPDFEVPQDANQDNTYEITITAGYGNLSVSRDVTVTVRNVNEAPTIAGPTAVDYAENSATNVASYTATDPEKETLVSWTVGGTDALHLAVNEEGVLSFKIPPDFELPSDANQDNTYEMEIIVSDGYLSDSHDVAVVVANANDAPSFPLEQLAAFIPENSCPGAYAILRGIPGNEGVRIDEDGDPLTFALSGADAAAFVIHPPTGYVTLGPGVALDHEAAKSTYVMRVSVADGRDADGNAEAIPVPDDFLELVASVTDVDEPPVFVESTLQRDRCGRPDGYVPVQLRREITRGSPVSAPAGDPIVAIDPEGSAVAYRMATGIAPAPFVIDPVSGRIMVSDDFDFSSRRRVYTVRVSASDGVQETAIETRISIISATALPPRPGPTPTPEPDEPEPIVRETEKPPSRSSEGDPQAGIDSSDSDTFSSAPTNFSPQIALQKFVQVAGAVTVQSLTRATAESDMGNASIFAPAGSMATPYQVRLRESGNPCADASQPLGATMRLCVAVELFDAKGDQLPPVRFNRPVSLQFVVQPTAMAPTGIGSTVTQGSMTGSLGVMSRAENMKEWRQVEFGTTGAEDGARILAASILEPGRFMVVSQPPLSVGLVQTPGPRVADSAQRLAPIDGNQTRATWQQDMLPTWAVRSAPMLPSANMIPISSPQQGTARGIPALFVALFLDVTLVLMTASILYRITRPRS